MAQKEEKTTISFTIWPEERQLALRKLMLKRQPIEIRQVSEVFTNLIESKQSAQEEREREPESEGEIERERVALSKSAESQLAREPVHKESFILL